MFEPNFNQQTTDNQETTTHPKQKKHNVFLYILFTLCLIIFCYQFFIKNLLTSNQPNPNDPQDNLITTPANSDCYFKRNKLSELKLVGVIIGKNKAFAFIKNPNGTLFKLTQNDKLGTHCEPIKRITLHGADLNSLELLFT